MGSTLPNSKEIWAAYCAQHYVPLYFRPWWMDCVCRAENWDVCLSLDRGGQVEGALVFHWKKKWGQRMITTPPLTTYTGLWLNPPNNLKRPSSRMAFEKKVCKNVVEQLPAHLFFYQQWHPSVVNWLPYAWQGFQQTTLYTYRLNQLRDTAQLFENMKASARTNLRFARQEVKVVPTEDVGLLFALHASSMNKSRLRPNFSLELLKRMDEELRQRNARQILLAKDQQSNVHAAIYLIWDEICTYFLLSGTAPKYKNSEAMYLLLWSAIEMNPGKTEVFDFEGAMLEPVERFFRSFGGELTPHFKMTRAKNRWWQMLAIALNKDF